MPFRGIVILCLVAGLSYSEPATAWGDAGHRLIAAIAHGRLGTDARVTVESLLREDKDAATARDFVSRATWADKIVDERKANQNPLSGTRTWHFAEVEITQPPGSGLQRACYGFRRLASRQLASEASPQDCILNKVEQFAAELSGLSEPGEKILALKFVIHLVGDLHQPVHVAQDFDYFGLTTIVRFPADPKRRSTDLHTYWDIDVVSQLIERAGRSEAALVEQMLGRLTPEEIDEWSAGNPREWILETIDLARNVVYDVPRPQKQWELRGGTFQVEDVYEARAREAASKQIVKAGLRLARVLNEAMEK